MFAQKVIKREGVEKQGYVKSYVRVFRTRDLTSEGPCKS